MEQSTVVFRQPADEMPQPLEVPYSCRFEGRWYREGEEFTMGQDGCSVCICVDTEVKCNDDNCIPLTTTSTTTSTTSTTTQLPFIEGGRGGQG